MGVTTNDMFGAAAAGELASTGSYGEAPPGFRLPDATRLGPVRLQVADLARSLAFYQHTLGLRVVDRNATRATLAPQLGDRVLVERNERKGARPATRGG